MDDYDDERTPSLRIDDDCDGGDEAEEVDVEVEEQEQEDNMKLVVSSSKKRAAAAAAASKRPKKRSTNKSTNRKSTKKGAAAARLGGGGGGGIGNGGAAGGGDVAPGGASRMGDPAGEGTLVLNPVLPKLDDGPELPVMLSKLHKAEKVELTSDRMGAGSCKGYRMVKATRGVVDGTWYFEIRVEHLGATGHTRLGWCTHKGDVQAPVGYDAHGYSYRDLDGSKVHAAWREAYAEPYVEGDTIGFYIHLPNGAALAPKPHDLVTYKGMTYAPETKEEPLKPVPGSQIAFFKNGIFQGIAFKDIYAGRYYPAASMYTLPNQENCTVRFNFGPDFAFAPSDWGQLEVPQAMSNAPFFVDGHERFVPQATTQVKPATIITEGRIAGDELVVTSGAGDKSSNDSKGSVKDSSGPVEVAIESLETVINA